MKKMVYIVFAVFALVFDANAISLNCMKMRSINSGGSSNQKGIFKDCFSRHFYEIKISNASPEESQKTYSLRVLPFLKVCKGGFAFPYFPGIVEYTDIKFDSKKSFTCVYYSPLTKWTKDTWPGVSGDWSKGLVNYTIAVELIESDKDTPVRFWTNSGMSFIRGAKSFEDGKSKLKKKYIEWLENEIDSKVKESSYWDEDARIEVGDWKSKCVE